MKRIISSALQACAVLLMCVLWSCADKKTSGLLSMVGDDARYVYLLSPEAVLKSLDARIEDGRIVLPGELQAVAGSMNSPVFDMLTKVRGLDFEQVMLASYGGADAFGLVRVKDEAALTRSLKDLDLKPRRKGDYVIFNSAGEHNASAVLYEGLLFIVPSSDAVRTMDGLVEKAKTPLAPWKTAAIDDCSGAAFFGLASPAVAAGKAVYVFRVDLDGAKAKARVSWTDANGKSLKTTDADGLQFASMGAGKDILDAGAMFNMAFCGFKDASVMDVLDVAGMGFYGAQYRGILKNLTGGFCLSGSVDMRSADMPRFFLTAALDATSGNAAGALEALSALATQQGLPVSAVAGGCALDLPGVCSVKASVKGDEVLVTADGGLKRDAGATVSLPDGCLFYVSCDITSENMAALNIHGFESGVNATMTVFETHAEAEARFGGDGGFLRQLASLLLALEVPTYGVL